MTELKPVNNINCLINKFCLVVGIVPTTFKTALTIEEQILALGCYLESEIYPAINQNANAVKELQELYIQLKDYVDNYFANLDVQTEINNKLDEMLKNGELQELITNYLKINGVLGFNTLTDLLNSENIVDGTFARTFGKNTLNDGDGAFYKIRNITNDDIIDGVNIIKITNSDTLIAELIKDNNIININQDINTINNEIENINIPNPLKNRKYLFVGDSYDNAWNPEQPTKRWSDVVIRLLNLQPNQYVQTAKGGVCFANEENSVLDLINLVPSDNKITDVVLCLGYNDQNYTSDAIQLACNVVDTLIKQKFPNAIIHLGEIGWSLETNAITKLRDTVYAYIHTANALGWHYLKNVEFSLKNYESAFNYDGVHPTSYGLEIIGRNVTQALIYGCADVVYPDITISANSSGQGDGLLFTWINKCVNNITSLMANKYSVIKFKENTSILADDETIIEIGTLNNGYIRGQLIKFRI